MTTDTKAGQTNYCPNCEDQARRIEELKADVKVARGQYQGACDIIKELERRERMLVDALSNAVDLAEKLNQEMDYLGTGTDGKAARKEQEDDAAEVERLREIINAIPTQSEAQEWNQHVEWMKKNLPVEATHCDVREERFFFEDDIKRLQRLPAGTQLVAIPELKEVKE